MEVLLVYCGGGGETRCMLGAVVSMVKFLVAELLELPERSVHWTYQLCRPWLRPGTPKIVFVLFRVVPLVWLSTLSMKSEQLAVGEKSVETLNVRFWDVLLRKALLAGETRLTRGGVKSTMKLLFVLVLVLPARSVQLTDQVWLPNERFETLKLVFVPLKAVPVWLSTPSMYIEQVALGEKVSV